jgi:urease accessory protein
MQVHTHEHADHHSHSHDHEHARLVISATATLCTKQSPDLFPCSRALGSAHVHASAAAAAGHTHEHLEHAGHFHERDAVIVRDLTERAMVVGCGGPVGSGKTALMLVLCKVKYAV